MASVSEDLNAIGRLANASAFQELDEFVPDLSFFDLLGCTRSERAHSRAIAALFDRRRHRHG
jgi:hypothetical protein